MGEKKQGSLSKTAIISYGFGGAATTLILSLIHISLNAALVAGGKEGAALTVSSETRDIDGGFVLTYGGIEENCSFDALFDSAHEMLQDKVQEILFGTV